MTKATSAAADTSARPEAACKLNSGNAADKTKKKRRKNWPKKFLEVLADTSNVSKACEKAGVERSEVYRRCRTNEVFAADWVEALCDGYDILELDVLGRLREDEPQETKFNFGAAMRLLAMHKSTVSKERARRSLASGEEVRKSIDRKIAEMRQTVLAREAEEQDKGDAHDPA